MVSRLLRIPVITHVRIFEDAAYLAALRPLSGWLRAMIAISESVESEIRQHAALDRIDTVRLYDAYQPQTTYCETADERPPERLVCVGRLAPIKGQDVLVAALHLLSSKGHKVTCAFAGAGDPAFTQALHGSSQCGAAQGSIEWLGNIDSVAELLHGASLLICPSHREPLGRVIFEAWDAGCLPIVFAGSGGAAEVVSASGGGLLYGQQTGEALASTIKQGLALSHDQRNTLIQLGRAWMQENLCPSKYGQAMASLFERSVAS